MKFVLYGVMAAGLCTAANADTINYNGLNYETVDWSFASTASNTAVGTVGGVGVTFETVDMSSDTIFNNDFSTDAGFDALSFGAGNTESGNTESISIFGGLDGISSINFNQNIGSLLILIGSPNSTSGTTQFGQAIWNFEDGLAMTMVDNELNPGLEIGLGNMLTNVIGGPGTHQSGVIGVSGVQSSLSWSQATGNGVDEMQITFAVAPATIPAPATGLALLLPAAMAGRRRRR